MVFIGFLTSSWDKLYCAVQLQLNCIRHRAGHTELPHKGLFGLAVVLFIVGAIAQVAPYALDYIPFLPQYDFRPMPIERLSTGPLASYGQYNFGNYIVLNSSRIASGSRVQGNVTFYGGYEWQQSSSVGILNEFDYIHAHPEDLAKLTAHLASFTHVGSCCPDPAYGNGYRVGFAFTSEETTKYYFLLVTGFNKATVDILEEQRVTPVFRTPLPWVIVSLAVGAVSFYKKVQPV